MKSNLYLQCFSRPSGSAYIANPAKGAYKLLGINSFIFFSKAISSSGVIGSGTCVNIEKAVQLGDLPHGVQDNLFVIS